MPQYDCYTGSLGAKKSFLLLKNSTLYKILDFNKLD